MTTSSLKALLGPHALLGLLGPHALLGLLARILVSASFFMLVAADHFTCTWTGFSTSDPSASGFSKFCVATYTKIDATHGSFRFGDGADTQVADWGYLHPQTIEFGTPCNGGGYGGDSCLHGKVWGVCLEHADDTRECRYLNRYDDCEWGTKFSESALPPAVSIWYQY